MNIEEILQSGTPQQVMAALKNKSITVPAWEGVGGLRSCYDPARHPVMSHALYPDIVLKDSEGRITGFQKVTRITYDLQRLAVKRMTELICGVPVKRIYKPQNEKQQEVAKVLEKIYERNRIDSLNIERCNMLFAGCEVMTLWYAVESPNMAYGIASPIKLRCRNFSPMLGDSIYPLFDEYGDLIALSVSYTRRVGNENAQFFDCYTAERCIKWSDKGGKWKVILDKRLTLGKIPAVYVYRPTPIWEDTSKMVYEMEWAMSRNGNYLRDNSKPLFIVSSDNNISFGNEDKGAEASKAILQFPQGATAQYVTWQQAVDNLKFYISELRQSFFTQLQLPDWSYESMKASPMSGESRKQLFIDAQLKVKDESGRLLEFFDRETNVLKTFVAAIMGASYADEIEALPVETIITPFTITDEKDTIESLILANGNKPLISQRESIQMLGWSDDVTQTMEEIQKENVADAFEPTI